MLELMVVLIFLLFVSGLPRSGRPSSEEDD